MILQAQEKKGQPMREYYDLRGFCYTVPPGGMRERGARERGERGGGERAPLNCAPYESHHYVVGGFINLVVLFVGGD